MALDNLTTKSNGIAFLVAAEVVLTVVAAACSSPQTAEINIDKRADTLMKWVNIGTVFAIFLVGTAAIMDPQHRKPLVMGGGITVLFMYGAYIHAKQSGLSNRGSSTET